MTTDGGDGNETPEEDNETGGLEGANGTDNETETNETDSLNTEDNNETNDLEEENETGDENETNETGDVEIKMIRLGGETKGWQSGCGLLAFNPSEQTPTVRQCGGFVAASRIAMIV